MSPVAGYFFIFMAFARKAFRDENGENIFMIKKCIIEPSREQMTCGTERKKVNRQRKQSDFDVSLVPKIQMVKMLPLNESSVKSWMEQQMIT